MKLMKKLRLKLRSWRREYLDFSSNTYKVVWAVLFFVLIALTLSLDLIPNQVDLRAGQVSQSDITAPRTINFIDEERTSELRQRAADTAPRVYEEDSTVEEDVLNKVNNLFENVISERQYFYKNKISLGEANQAETENVSSSADSETISENQISNLTDPEKTEIIDLIREELDFEIGSESLAVLISLSNEELTELKNRAINLLQQNLDSRILPSDLTNAREDLRQRAMEIDIARDQRLALAEIVELTIAANMFLNQEATSNRREEAISEVEAVEKTVRQGEIIVRKGDVVTEADIDILERLGLQKSGINYYNITGRILISFILVLLLGFYFYKYHKSV